MSLVSLGNMEMRVAALVGTERRIEAITKTRRTKFTGTNDPWAGDILGVLGELAVAKRLNRYPGFTDGPDYRGDIRPNIEVRSTTHANGCLILQPKDAPDRPYVLVRGASRELDVAGWILGADGMQSEYWRTINVPFPAFFVPATALHPITELVGLR